MRISLKSEFKDQISPIIFQASSKLTPQLLIDLLENPDCQVIDTLENQVENLIKANNVSKKFSAKELKEEIADFFLKAPKDDFGNWVYYPWKNTLVRLLPEKEFIQIRTLRNNYKITPEEQAKLREKKIGIVGLSVGLSIALAIAMERSCGELRLADFDTLELTNLNRVKAGVTSLGVEKVVIAAREISEIDPYLKLTLFRGGVDESNIDRFISEDGKLDLLIDECDSLDIKFLLRERAKKFEIPILMETSDRGMVDIERFDEDSSREIFHGKIGAVDYADLKNLSSSQKVTAGLKITGVETLSARMKASLLEINESISSWPQLASAVFLGGGTIAHVGRKILLGEKILSGRYYIDLDELIGIGEDEKVLGDPEQFATKSDFIAQAKASILSSEVSLSKEEISDLVDKANKAPSGGNCQPWVWIFDKKGVLHLFHDQEKSSSLLDYKGTGSLIAFGAALENIRLRTLEIGLEIEIVFHADRFNDSYIASVVFLNKKTSPIAGKYSYLEKGIDLRCTNRVNSDRKPLPKGFYEDSLVMANNEGLSLEIAQQPNELEKLSNSIGGMDRLRILHERGYSDFISEIRWSPEEAKKSLDGIDIATLELNESGTSALRLIKDPKIPEFFRKHDLGYALTKISDESIYSSSAILMILAKDFSPKSYLSTGKVLQQIWLKANLEGISMQPVSASLFIYHYALKEKHHGFDERELALLKNLKGRMNQVFNKDTKQEEMFMVRLNIASGPSIRAYRRPVSDSLIIL